MRVPRILLWILLYLALAEVALEVRANRRGYDTLLFGSAAAVAASAPDAARAYGPTAAFPFRSALVDSVAPAGTFRLWLASASYAEDVYQPADRIFPVLLAELLTAAGRPTEVLNASRAGHTIGSNTGFLLEAGPAWRPDAALLYQMSLDVNVLSRQLLGGKGGTTGPAGAGGDDTKQEPPPVVRLYESTTIFQTLKEAVAGRVTGQRILARSLGPEGPRLFRARLEEFVAAARAQGIPPVLCTFAASHTTETVAEMPSDRRASLYRYNVHLSVEGWVVTVDELNAVIADVARDLDVPLVDVAPRIAGRPELFRDFIHFTPEGHAALAAVLAEELAVIHAGEVAP